MSSKKKSKPVGVVTLDDPRLWNISQLAVLLGVDRHFITRLKRSGFKMPFGKASLASVHEFMRAQSDGVESEMASK
jgi:hypothetical protein